MTWEPVWIRKYRETVKKRKHHPYAEAVKISYEEGLKVRQKVDEADFRKKTATNAFADFKSRLMPTGNLANFLLLLLLRLHLKRCAAGSRRT